MGALRLNILFKSVTLVLVLAFLLPSAVKFMHIFEQHQHEICLGESDSHFHTQDVDCEFYKFKLNSPFTIPKNTIVLLAFSNIESAIPTHYSFLSEFQTLHFSLRGPPSINLI